MQLRGYLFLKLTYVIFFRYVTHCFLPPASLDQDRQDEATDFVLC